MKVRWEIDDNYAGSSTRPQKTDISEDDIKDCEDIDDAMQMIADIIQEDYEQNISWYIPNREKVKKQVQEILDKREED
jgi:hypothetical protein